MTQLKAKRLSNTTNTFYFYNINYHGSLKIISKLIQDISYLLNVFCKFYKQRLKKRNIFTRQSLI